MASQLAPNSIPANVFNALLAMALAAVAAASTVAAADTADAADTSPSVASVRSSVIELTNDERTAKGCDPLKPNKKLTIAAQRHADDMDEQGYFSHTSANGTSWDRRIRNAGYTKPGGENIAYGQTSADEVVTDWMNSPGHRRNILDCGFETIGIGYNAEGNYWVQDFGR